MRVWTICPTILRPAWRSSSLPGGAAGMSIVSTRQRSIRRAIRARSRDPGTPAPKPGRGPSRRLGMAVARLAGLVRSRRARRSRWARHGVLVGGLTLVLILVLPIVGLAHHLYF